MSKEYPEKSLVDPEPVMNQPVHVRHWDPKPHEYLWFKQRETGDRAYLVVRDSKWQMMLARSTGQMEHVRKWDPSFEREMNDRPVTRMQLAIVAFAADEELRRLLDDRKPVRDWQELTHEERIAFANDGPGVKAHPQRHKCYKAVFASQEGLVQ